MPVTGVMTAFARALGQLGDRRVLAVLVKSMGVTLAIFAALAALKAKMGGSDA